MRIVFQLVTFIICAFSEDIKSRFEQRLDYINDHLLSKYYLGDIFQDAEIDIEYPRPLVFHGQYNADQIKQHSRDKINERFKNETMKQVDALMKKVKEKFEKNAGADADLAGGAPAGPAGGAAGGPATAPAGGGPVARRRRRHWDLEESEGFDDHSVQRRNEQAALLKYIFDNYEIDFVPTEVYY